MAGQVDEHLCVLGRSSLIDYEADLIGRAQDGDLDAFELLVRKYQDRVYTIAYQIVGSRDDAQDVCQESFLKLHNGLAKYRPKNHFTTWLYRLVTNAAIDFLRRERRHRHEGLEQHDLATATEPDSFEDLMYSLRRLLTDLSPKQRSAFVLRDLQQYPLDQIAQILGCSTITVRVHLHNARVRLRHHLGEREG